MNRKIIVIKKNKKEIDLVKTNFIRDKILTVCLTEIRKT